MPHMPTSPSIIFFGTEAYSAPTLQALIESSAHVAAVVTKPDAPSGRGRTLSSPPVKQLAEQHHLPVFQPGRLRDILPDLTALQPTTGVLVAFGKIIPQDLLDLFPRGIINIHPSLLPAYRGPAPIEDAILRGDTKTGVTLMRLDAGMDTGPIYAQEHFALTGQESRQHLYDQLFGLGTQLLLQHLPAILDGTLQPTPQSATDASVTHMFTKADGILDWTKPATQLEREIRAYLGWPGSRTTIDHTEVIITAAHVAPEPPEAPKTPGTPFRTPEAQLAIQTATNPLIIDHLKPAGKREMTGPEFLAGHSLDR